ncbi:uncharacterized protein FPRO_12735 [Fusarium proliferatum ET1]|uniref:Uncharacterized protein n=1 Tax=Fusarium proliferatum (strain ET1) TaxID=1227346 RepID=A0A1L7W684_FUSPR|nr:uncharacterized protein FPRO_12735 [Fusarium proliferatum ET1]CZR48125.1 uncharacterized protein FPRO_12735 [Fusarium proliferatum ET1]
MKWNSRFSATLVPCAVLAANPWTTTNMSAEKEPALTQSQCAMLFVKTHKGTITSGYNMSNS